MADRKFFLIQVAISVITPHMGRMKRTLRATRKEALSILSPTFLVKYSGMIQHNSDGHAARKAAGRKRRRQGLTVKLQKK